MKTLLIAAALTALVATPPISALAQAPDPAGVVPGGPISRSAEPGVSRWPLDRREDWLQGRIDRSADRGWLSGNEISRGRSELRAIRAEQSRLLARDGGALSPMDRRYLAERLNELNATLRWQGENPPPPWS